MPLAQKRLLKLAGQLARPSITATQMLDSMVSSPRPTRAEATDVANAIFDGTDAVMLSQETAVGQYPVETVAMMASIAENTEQGLPYREWNEGRVRRDARDPAYTVAYSACAAARELHLAAIVTPTLSGRSARLVASHRPNVPIYALSPGRETVRRCGLMWGVRAASMRRHEVTEALIADSARRVVELGWVKPGQRVAITAGLPERPSRHDQPAADPARLRPSVSSACTRCAAVIEHLSAAVWHLRRDGTTIYLLSGHVDIRSFKSACRQRPGDRRYGGLPVQHGRSTASVSPEEEAAAALVHLSGASSITVAQFEASIPPDLAAASSLVDQLSATVNGSVIPAAFGSLYTLIQSRYGAGADRQ